MGKMYNSMILSVMITLALLIFNGTGETPTALFLILLNPAGWENSQFWGIFIILGTAGVGIITIGAAALLKQDWILRAGMMIGLSTIVIAPFIDLMRFFMTQSNYFAIGCANAPGCNYVSEFGGIGQFLAIVVAGPLLLYAMWACIEWVFKGDHQ